MGSGSGPTRAGAYDPQQTQAGLKSRSAARPGVISSSPLHDPRGRVVWRSDGVN
jgi:hypothetical protein